MSALLLSGCWDARDIEDRGYVMGVAIDSYPPMPLGQESPSEDAQERPLEVNPLDTGVPKYAYTVQLPIIKLGRLPNQQGGGGEPDTPRTWEITQAGNSIFEMNRTLSTRTNTALYYEHLQVIIISEDVARQGLYKVLDFFIRDPEMRSRTKIFVTQGDAKAVLDVIPRIEDYSSIYLAKIINNARSTAKMIHWTDLGKAAQLLYQGDDFALAHVQVSKDEVKNIGAGVFREDKLVGWINGTEVEAGKLISDLYIGGTIISSLTLDQKGFITLEVTKAQTNITPQVVNDQIRFKIDIDIEGNLVDATDFPKPESFDTAHLEQAEIAFQDSVKSQCADYLNKMQHEFKTDINGFGRILEANKPDVWEQIKEDWRYVYPQTKMDITVKVSIKQMGNIR